MAMTRLEATTKARRLIENRNFEEFAKELGITKVTLYSRFAKHNWKKSEMFMLENMK